MNNDTQVAHVPTPSNNMIAAVEAAATRRAVTAPKGYKTDFVVCKEFLERGDANAVSVIDKDAEQYQNAKAYIAANDVGITHFRHTFYANGDKLVDQFGGLTVAFRRVGNYLHIATAVCSDDDNYSSKQGTILAVDRLVADKFIVLPLQYQTPQELVEALFRDQFTDAGASCNCPSCAAGPSMQDRNQAFPLPIRPLLFVVQRRQTPTVKFDANEIASKYFPKGASADEEVWAGQARNLLAAILQKLEETNERTAEKLKHFIEEATNTDLIDFLTSDGANVWVKAGNLLDASRATLVTRMKDAEAASQALAGSAYPQTFADFENRMHLPSTLDEVFGQLSKSKNGQAAADFISKLFNPGQKFGDFFKPGKQ